MRRGALGAVVVGAVLAAALLPAPGVLAHHGDLQAGRVRGDGYYETTNPPKGEKTAVWSCTATARKVGVVVPVGTFVQCELWLDDVRIGVNSKWSAGGAVATVRRETAVGRGRVQVCWRAVAGFSDGQVVWDEVLPNCKG